MGTCVCVTHQVPQLTTPKVPMAKSQDDRTILVVRKRWPPMRTAVAMPHMRPVRKHGGFLSTTSVDEDEELMLEETDPKCC